MKGTICWEVDNSYINTLSISGIALLVTKCPLKVKNFYMFTNQPVTNSVYNYSVDTSETIRPLSSKTLTKVKNQVDYKPKFNEWLAGLICGDGSLLVSKAGYPSCEITMGLEDEHALLQIKQKLGGSIKLRSGVKAIRYRLHHKEGMMNLIHRINGHIRHTDRLEQLKKVCLSLNISLIKPRYPSMDNGWFAGFFDACGTITFSFKGERPQLTISVSNKKEINILPFKYIFGGNIYYDKSGYGYFKWTIQSKSDIFVFVNYLKTQPCRSYKRHRIFLVNKYYYLVELKAYNSYPDSALYKAWIEFEKQWSNK